MSGIEAIVGPVVNTFPMRLQFSESTSVPDVLQAVHRLLVKNGEFEAFPLAAIQAAAGRRGLFDSIVDFQPESWELGLDGGASMRFVEVVDRIGTPLSFRFVVQPDGSMAVMATSESTAYDAAFLEATLRNLQLVLGGVAKGADSVGALRRLVAKPPRSGGRKPVLRSPDIPVRPVVGQGSGWRAAGRLPSGLGNQSLKEAEVFAAFAASLDHWSSGSGRFAVRTARGWRGASVVRAASMLENVDDASLDVSFDQSSDGPAVVAAFSYASGEDLAAAGANLGITTLFCFHAAGANAAQFDALRTAVGDRFAVVAPELPGHGMRRGEPLLTDIAAVVASIVKDHGDAMTGRYGLLGVSFGALVAFEVSKHMQVIGRGCTHLLVASEAAPSCVTPDVDPCLPDDAMVREMSARGWLPSEIVEGGPEVWSVVLPVFKADLGCEAAYVSAPPSAGHDLLHCPVTVMVGDQDHELFADECARVQAWEDVSVGGAKRITVVGGGHLFVENAAGCNAIIDAAGGDGAEGASVSLTVRGATWELLGDDGLVPPLVLEGIGTTFATFANAILEGIQAPLRELVPRQVTARPIADPTPLDQRLLHDEFVSNERNRPASAAVIDLGTGKTISYKDFGRMSLLVAAGLRRAGVGNADTVAIVAKKGFQQLIGAVRRALGWRASPDAIVQPCRRAAVPLCRRAAVQP